MLGFERLDSLLPIFRRSEGDAVIYYAPGYVARMLASNQTGLNPATFENLLRTAQDAQAWPVSTFARQEICSIVESAPAIAAALVRHAQAAQSTWARLHTHPYQPVCLTIYPENRCNLRCIYCYAGSTPQGEPVSQNARRRVSTEAVRDTAELVAANCQSRGLPLTLVMHGGGEPALDLHHLAAIVDIAERSAKNNKIGLFKYIATNGVMTPAKACWLAKNFDLIGISCDGPADIQKQQRPRLNGENSTPSVERTAHIIHTSGAPYHLRVTVTPQTMERLDEITHYLCTRFKPQEIHIEPVYQGGRAHLGGLPAEGEEATQLAGTFVEQYTQARDRANQYGIRMLFAGCRPWEIHGPYCQIFRDVLTLIPGDEAALCFKFSDADQVEKADARIGWMESDGFTIDHQRIRQFRELLSARPASCQDCFNQYHCAGGCPDDCALELSPFKIAQQPPNEFRCQVQMRLASAAILQAGRQVVLSSRRPCRGNRNTGKKIMDPLETFFNHGLPTIVDAQRIHREWLAIQGAYDVSHWKLPLPFWAKRNFDNHGEQAWAVLQDELPDSSPDQPMCIYLHAPYCSSKCAFCDSYSFPLSPSRTDQKQEYVDRLCTELDLWAETGTLARRPVPTVHLGGGTPTFLGEKLLSRLVYRCIDRFNISSETEWALESNTTELTPKMLEAMQDLGFRRLHLGVQTMEDAVRKVIGRRQPAKQVLEVVRRALGLGWVVSVDLIVGLPGQTMPGVLNGIQALIDAGVNGFSLYELLIYPQNQKWAEHYNLHKRDHLPNYYMFQAGAALIEGHGFRKNLFNHWADEKDRNTYFTFPMRGEDLLAVGCIADGVFGDYHYRHLGLDDYLIHSRNGKPGLAGGLRRNDCEKQIHPLILAIQSGHILEHQAALLNALPSSTGQGLVDHWIEHALVEKEPGNNLRLTNNGSWFAGNMIAEVSDQILTMP